MFRNIILLGLLVAAGVLVASWLRRPKRLFEIRVSEDDVLVLGPVPNKNQAEVRTFVSDLRLPVGARVMGIERGPSFRLLFSASVRQDDRDRVRSYLEG